MFKIDLLKGQNIPIKSTPYGIAIIAAAVVIPVIIMTMIIGLYFSNRISAKVQEQELENYKKKIEGLSGAIKTQESFEAKKDGIIECISEAKNIVGSHIQWSPILAELISNLPTSVSLTSLEVKQNSTRLQVPQKDNPEVMISVSVPVHQLLITMQANPRTNCDKDVKKFRDQLWSSDLLRPKLEEIRVSQEFNSSGSGDIILYKIDCAFKPQL